MRKLLLLPLIAGATLVASSLPASAQYVPATVTATPGCSNLRDQTTWITITVTSPTVGGTVVDVSAVDATPTPDVPKTVTLVGTNPIPAGDSAQWIAEMPGTFTGTVAVTVAYTEGGMQETYNQTVQVTTPCIAPTTTTTAPSTTTTAAQPSNVTPAFTG